MGFTTIDEHIKSIPNVATKQAPTVAFFDLDGTLIAGYSIIAMALETARKGAKRGKLKESASLIKEVLRHKAGGNGGNYHRLVRRLSHALAGMSEDSLSDIGYQAYQNSLAKNLYREAIALVEAHREAGHHLAIVTSASRYQAAPIARVLGIDEICCTQLEVIDGRFSGKVVAPMCYGEGKTLAARRVTKRLRTKLEHCWFYSDSSADLPLLREVGHAVAVNPSSRLAAQATSRDWPQLFFETRGLPSVESILRTGLTAQTLAATALLGAVGNRLGMANDKNANMLTRVLGDVGSSVAGLDFEIEGLENLNRKEPAIFIFNHQSLLDAFVLAHLLREDVVAFCKKEVADTPLLGPLMRQVETIFVDRDEKNQSAVLQQALEVLASGRSLVIAPEGTRSTLGNVQAFKHGAFFLAKKARVPIVPIVLHNVKDALPKGGLIIRPATIRVTVLPPMQASQLGSVRQACQKLESLYIEHLGKSKLTALPFEATA
ncbi:MAG: HAD-IB family hydrolase [Halioglobus sp.]